MTENRTTAGHRVAGVWLVLIALTALIAPAGLSLAEEAATKTLTAEQVELNIQSFDMIWQTIRDKHWDPELGGIDWQAVRDTLRPKVETATTMDEARGYMRDAIYTLGQSHFGVFPADVYDDAAGLGDEDDADDDAAADDDLAGDDGVTGMEVRLAGDQLLVYRVQADSPAAVAGITPGWQITSIKGKDVAPRIEKLRENLGEEITFRLIVARAMGARLEGDVGDTIGVGFIDGQDREVALDLVLAPQRGKSSPFGNLPAVNVWYDKAMLDRNIGYFGFNFFLGIMEVMPAYNEAMKEFAGARGIIIDLRGNLGGIGAMSMGMSGWFFADKGHELGTMITRGGQLKFSVNPRPNAFKGPVAVLVDDLSASTAEIMAGGLKDLGRARLFGTATAGAALPSVIERLPNGDGFQYAIANYISKGGDTLEGGGVTPDVLIPHSRESLLAGDAVLDAAVQWIDEQNR